VEGITSVNEAMITGESTPIEKAEQDKVIGGAVNAEGSITVELEKTGQDTYLSQVVEMVRKAQESQSRAQDLANRAVFYLTIVALGVGGITLAAWLAAALERHSEHPIARGIVAEAEERKLDPAEAKDFEAIPGKGARAKAGGSEVKVVSTGYLKENGIALDERKVKKAAQDGKTVVYLLVDDNPEGAVALADMIRVESHHALSTLKQMGVRVMMLTGDSEAVARWVAEELEVDESFAEVLPDKKAEKIKEVKKRGFTVAMVGDGVNDAPALSEADIGIAIGAGTDVAIEAADIVLVRSDPRDVTEIVELSRATYSKIVQNLWWAAGYNIVAIPLAAGVLFPVGILLPPAVGALVMSVSNVIVAVNARLLGRAGTGERSFQ
jgi:P-type Cu2+ transporter